MKMSPNVRRGLMVCVGFGAFIAASLLIGNWVGDRPSPGQVCTQKCAEQHKTGRLVYSGPATSKEFYKQANSTCECY